MINYNQNPINNICPSKNYNFSTDKVEFWNNNRLNNFKSKNDIFNINNYTYNSFYSARSCSYNNKNNNNNTKRMKNKNKFNKNMILKNIKVVKIKGKTMAELHNQATH